MTHSKKEASKKANRKSLYIGSHDHSASAKLFWSVDSEFLSSGKIGDPYGVEMIQFAHLKTPENIPVFDSSDDLKNWLQKNFEVSVCENPNELKTWVKEHRYVHDLFCFVLLCDLASIKAWLCPNVKTFAECPHVKIHKKAGLTFGLIDYAGAKIRMWDVQPLLKTLGLRRLEDAGEVLGIPKLNRPSWLGERSWSNDLEHQELIKYASFDPVITANITKWLIEKIGADPRKHVSMATLTKEIFDFPKRLPREPEHNRLSPLERYIASSLYAGRSECIVSGFTPSAYYNDISSQYPVSLARVRAFQIIGAEQCEPKEIVVNQDLNERRFGWLEGTFETERDIWGLPLRGRNNFFALGTVSGLYHSFDLSSAHAKIIHIIRAWKPVFSDNPKDIQRHEKYVDLLLRKLEGGLDPIEKMKAKGLLNTAYGKLIQSDPVIARTSNFYAGSCVLAFSHFLLSKLIDKCSSPILGMDTDSIFTQSDMSGKYWELTDAYGSREGQHSIPVKMDVKAKGDLVFFRAKQYLMKGKDGFFGGLHIDENGEKKRSEGEKGRHGWNYFIEDYCKLFDGEIEELVTRREVKHTLLTREVKAKQLEYGRWETQPVKLPLGSVDEEKTLKHLLRTDWKRKRETYDSYELVRQRKNCVSCAWKIDELLGYQSAHELQYPILSLGAMTLSQLMKQLKFDEEC